MLPTKDLVFQVERVFARLCQGTKVTWIALAGEGDLKAERRRLSHDSDKESMLQMELPSMIDIVISTPGRLLEHLQTTNGFRLNHLAFLVMDEVDRLLELNQWDWLKEIHDAILCDSTSSAVDTTYTTKTFQSAAQLPVVSLSEHQTLPYSTRYVQSVRKLLFSATFTSNPLKLSSLHLREPLQVIFQPRKKRLAQRQNVNSEDDPAPEGIETFQKYVTPSTLSVTCILSADGTLMRSLIALSRNT